MAKYLTPVLILVVAVLAVALAVKGGEIVTGMSVLEVHPSNFSVAGANVNPTMTTPECYQTSGTQGALGSITLIGNDTITVVCNTTVSDNNGCADFNTTTQTGRLYKDTVGAGCSASYKDCYQNASCAPVGSCTGTGGVSQIVECTYTVQYNADNTSVTGWNGTINITDTASAKVNDTDASVGVGALLAIHVDHTLDLGSVAAGSNQSTCSVDHSTWNYGNVQLDLQLNGTALDCPSPYTDIPVGYLQYNCTDDDAPFGTNSTALTGAPASTGCTSFDLAKSSTTTGSMTASTDKTYWGVGIPTGSGGTCWGTIHFTAIAG